MSMSRYKNRTGFKRRKKIKEECPNEFKEIVSIVEQMPDQHRSEFEKQATDYGWEPGDGEVWLTIYDIEPTKADEMKAFLSTITEKHQPPEALCYVLAAVCVMANKNKLMFKAPKGVLWDFTRKMLKRAQVRNELAQQA